MQGRFASRRGTTVNREALKIVYPAFLSAILLINIFGFYPKPDFHPVFSAVIYTGFFACLFLIEKKSGEISEKASVRLIYLLFAVMLTLAGMSGGIASPLKWALYVAAFTAAAGGRHLHSFVMLTAVVLSSVRQYRDFASYEIFLFAASFGFAGLHYYTAGKKAAAGADNTVHTFESSAESRDFRVIASELLEKILNVYRALLGAETMMFFVREPGQEGEYSLMMSSSGVPDIVDREYRLRVKEGLLGAALNKKDFFQFETGSVKMPYYTQKNEIREAVTMPVTAGGRIIAAISADFKAEPREKEQLRARMQNLSAELISIMQLFDINSKVISRERRVSLLYDIYGKLNLLDGKKEMMQSFFEEIKAFDIYSGYLAEFMPETRDFTVTECFNCRHGTEGSRISAQDDEVLKYICAAGAHMIVDDAAGKNLRINFKMMNVDKFFISILKNKNETFGFIKLDKEKGYAFTEFEVKTLQMILARITVLLENIRLYEKIKKQATLDGLTGLFNHLTFQEKLAGAMSRKDNSYSWSVFLALIDIDFFKKFNDSFGHQEGDRVLKKLAGALRMFSEKYPETFPARYGGEEFVFVMENCDLRKAGHIAEEIRAYCEDNLRGGDEKEKRKITLSIGLAGTDKAKIPREIIKNADDALYLAKQEGRNRVKVF